MTSSCRTHTSRSGLKRSKSHVDQCTILNIAWPQQETIDSDDNCNISSTRLVSLHFVPSLLLHSRFPSCRHAPPQNTRYGKYVELDIPKEAFPTDAEIQAMEDALPECQQHGWFESNGAQLHYRKFMPPEQPRGVVVYQHGILAHTGNAFILKDGRKVNSALMADSFNKAGYALYALDMLGHGFSEGLRWFVPDWKVNRDDLDNFTRFVASENPGIPLFLFGESYGSTTALHLARKWQDSDNAPEKFAGVVVIAPAIVSDMPPYPVVFTLRYILAPIFPRWVPFFMPNPVSADRIWRENGGS